MTDNAGVIRADDARPLARLAASAKSVTAQRRATRIMFFTLGFGTASWAPLVPYAKARLGLDNHSLGLMLLCLGFGSLLAMPVAGALANRFGCRAVLVCLSIVLACALPVLSVASSLPLMVTALFAFGAALGAYGVTVNIQAIAVERASGRPVMSGFHAHYSIGGILGAAGMVGLLGLGTPVLAAALCAGCILVIALPIAGPNLLSDKGETGGTLFAMPKGIVTLIGLLCFVTFLAEGAMLDWGAVFLSSTDGMTASTAGLGYTVFATAMSAGRLSGDAIVARLGRIKLVMGGGCCAGLGFIITTIAPTWPLALVGFAIIGAGCANVAPSLFSIVGRQTRMPESDAMSAVSTFGYGGILVGPALIGFVAAATSLHIAFLGLACALGLVAVCARYLPR
ncbi:MFS transporter [Acidisoma cellulosilytica]|uniref:MFS transporter n=1 Tax=Acidisoma cellulosilyticum TaxID=2802395 RepID=A0A963YX43_9PROT|nr:MFS transporter [Acidisoma cellulosilyticum]MCB8878736.1 MFS transporter [Acidisoma cellulosilyticum]